MGRPAACNLPTAFNEKPALLQLAMKVLTKFTGLLAWPLLVYQVIGGAFRPGVQPRDHMHLPVVLCQLENISIATAFVGWDQLQQYVASRAFLHSRRVVMACGCPVHGSRCVPSALLLGCLASQRCLIELSLTADSCVKRCDSRAASRSPGLPP